jgi:hypothetical protein
MHDELFLKIDKAAEGKGICRDYPVIRARKIAPNNDARTCPEEFFKVELNQDYARILKEGVCVMEKENTKPGNSVLGLTKKTGTRQFGIAPFSCCREGEHTTKAGPKGSVYV